MIAGVHNENLLRNLESLEMSVHDVYGEACLMLTTKAGNNIKKVGHIRNSNLSAVSKGSKCALKFELHSPKHRYRENHSSIPSLLLFFQLQIRILPEHRRQLQTIIQKALR